MAELTPQERLQPSLLDRLTDDEPSKNQESREKRVLSLTKLRAAVLRDLGWLLNSTSARNALDPDRYPLAARSVISYGIPDLTGHTASGLDLHTVEGMLRQSICDFEPRIVRDSLVVRAMLDESRMSHNTLMFSIEGELWAQPAPLHVLIQTEFDLEAHQVKVSEAYRAEHRVETA